MFRGTMLTGKLAFYKYKNNVIFYFNHICFVSVFLNKQF